MARAAFINVTEPPYSADPTGTIDCSAAFQMALNQAGTQAVSPEPHIVFAPAGIYLIARPISVPRHVQLQGTWDSPPDCGSFFPSLNQPPSNRRWWIPEVYRPYLKGTVFVTDYGRHIEDRSDLPALITLEGPSSLLKGVWIFYPRQGVGTDQTGFEVIPYQWTIRIMAESCTVSEVLLQNSYSGIDCSNYGARHVLKHIWGQPLREGIRVGRCFDVGRILDVHFWPLWDHGTDRVRGRPDPAETLFRDFTNRHGFALVLFKSDMRIVHDFFAFGYFAGVHLGIETFRDDPADSSKATGVGACTGQSSNLNLDQCTIGIDFHATDKSGIQITNANIVCRDLPENNPTLDAATDTQERHAIVAHPHPDQRERFPWPSGFLALRGGSVFGFTKHPMIAWESAHNTLMVSSSWFKNETAKIDYYDNGQVREVHVKDGRATAPIVTTPIINVMQGRAIIQGNWFQRLNGGRGS